MVSASSGQNPITGVTYESNGVSEPVGALTQLTYGSRPQDIDAFQYDINTGRMTQYKFTVN